MYGGVFFPLPQAEFDDKDTLINLFTLLHSNLYEINIFLYEDRKEKDVLGVKERHLRY